MSIAANDGANLKLMFAAEMFSKLNDDDQDRIINLIKDLLLHGG